MEIPEFDGEEANLTNEMYCLYACPSNLSDEYYPQPCEYTVKITDLQGKLFCKERGLGRDEGIILYEVCC